jgi:hypothetical protein
MLMVFPCLCFYYMVTPFSANALWIDLNFYCPQCLLVPKNALEGDNFDDFGISMFIFLLHSDTFLGEGCQT